MKCISIELQLIKCYGIEIVNVTLHFTVVVVAAAAPAVGIFQATKPSPQTLFVCSGNPRDYIHCQRHKSKPTQYSRYFVHYKKNKYHIDNETR